MKISNFNQVCLAGIVSATAVLITALTLEFTGVVDLGCNTQGCKVRLEKVSGKSE